MFFVASNIGPNFTDFVNSTNMYLNRFDKKLDAILDHLKQHSTAQSIPLDDSILCTFPLKDIAVIIQIEENLKNDEYKLKVVK